MDLYTDYLLSSFGQVTAAGLSNLLERILSHDKIHAFCPVGSIVQKNGGNSTILKIINMRYLFSIKIHNYDKGTTI